MGGSYREVEYHTSSSKSLAVCLCVVCVCVYLHLYRALAKSATSAFFIGFLSYIYVGSLVLSLANPVGDFLRLSGSGRDKSAIVREGLKQ